MTLNVVISLIEDKLNQNSIYDLTDIDCKIEKYIKDSKPYFDYLFNGNLVFHKLFKEKYVHISKFQVALNKEDKFDLYIKVIKPFIKKSFDTLNINEEVQNKLDISNYNMKFGINSSKELYTSIFFGDIKKLMLEILIFRDRVITVYFKDTANKDYELMSITNELKFNKKDSLTEYTILTKESKLDLTLKDFDFNRLNILLYYLNSNNNDFFGHNNNTRAIEYILNNDKEMFDIALKEINISKILSY